MKLIFRALEKIACFFMGHDTIGVYERGVDYEFKVLRYKCMRCGVYCDS